MSHIKTLIVKFGGASLSNVDKIKQCIQQLFLDINSNPFFSQCHNNTQTNAHCNVIPIIVVSAMGNTTANLHKSYKQITTVASQNTDMILATGEMVSAGMFSLALQELGFKSQAICGWQIPIITTNNYGNAEIIEIKSNKLNTLIHNKIIPVVTGFQGISLNGEITTLGKSSSDLTAVALAAKFQCKCYIYKEVDGVFSCDPITNNKIDNMKKISNISYHNMHIASQHGANILCDKAVEYAKHHKINIEIKSACNSNNGTTISANPSLHNLVTKQQAFLIYLSGDMKVPEGHAFLSYDKSWCLLTSEIDYLNYIQQHKQSSFTKYTKITLVHPNKISEQQFIEIISDYSNIFSCMEYYSWVCVDSKYEHEIEKALHDQFVN